MRAVEERVSTLESLLGEFIVHTDVALNRLEREMQEFKDEMKEFKDRMEASHKEMNKQWTALAKKMGTLDEDLIAPAVRPVLEKYFSCEPLARSIRNQKKKKNGDNFEVDVLAVCEDKVFMVEVKSSPKPEHVEQILEKASIFKDFFPEYSDKELMAIYASISFPDEIVKHASRKGLYVMAYREWEYMDIINFDDVSKSGSDV